MSLIDGFSHRSPYLVELEGYLDARDKGRALPYDKVPSSLKRLDYKNATALSNLGPNAQNLYGEYSTAFSYDQRARFIYGLSGLVDSLANLQGAVNLSVRA